MPPFDDSARGLRLIVAVLTYKRPQELEFGLPWILKQAADLEAAIGVAADVLVIDNDPVGSAEPLVRGFARPGLRYVLEPEPGIAAGRNRALSEGRDHDLLVFIDDDECPREAWLTSLVQTWKTTRPAAVMGRVESRLDTTLPAWVEAGDFFRRPRMPTGTEIPVAAAGNLLLDLNQLRALDVRFDSSLGLGGGEDSLLSRTIVRRGGRIVWCDESVADDHVPPTRTTREWLLKRSWSHGNTTVLVDLMMADTGRERIVLRARWAAQGLARMAVGAGLYTVGVLAHSLRHNAQGLWMVYRGAGMTSGALGIVYREYHRSEKKK